MSQPKSNTTVEELEDKLKVCRDQNSVMAGFLSKLSEDKTAPESNRSAATAVMVAVVGVRYRSDQG